MAAVVSSAGRTSTDDGVERSQLLEHGFVVFKGMLSADDIAELRRACLGHFETSGVFALMGKTQPNAFHYIPGLRRLLTDRRLLDALAAGSGRSDCLFTFHSDAHKDIVGGWHRDTDGYFDFSETLDDTFAVYKFAIYLEDHLSDDAGFTCRPGSHRSADPSLPEITLHTAPGDVVLFDVRLLHHGQWPDFLEQALRVVRPAGLQTGIRTLWAGLLRKPSKLSIFYTYGAPNRFTEQFSERNVARQVSQHGPNGPAVSDEVRALLDAEGLEYCRAGA